VRVFLTGGTGLVGRHVIAALTARGDEVLALARSAAAAAALREAGAAPVPGDITDHEALRRGVAASDATVHAAAVVLPGAGWEAFHATNVVPTVVLARAAAAARARLVHISSVAVYGRKTTYDGGPGSVTEDFPLDAPMFAGDHYTRSKREAERAVWHVREETGLSAVALRPCVIYGEHDRAVCPRAARLVRLGVAPLVGRGDNPMTLVYAGNVALAVLAALDRPQVTGAFNIANDGVITQRDFIERFARGMGRRVRLVPIPAAFAWGAARAVDAGLRALPGERPMSLLKLALQFLGAANPFVSARAGRELGWMPRTSAADGVDRTARWFRDHPQA
jgi:nucleoside-diphosphate-sugar epimerase